MHKHNYNKFMGFVYVGKETFKKMKCHCGSIVHVRVKKIRKEEK